MTPNSIRIELGKDVIDEFRRGCSYSRAKGFVAFSVLYEIPAYIHKQTQITFNRDHSKI
jgi:hypothetical protein